MNARFRAVHEPAQAAYRDLLVHLDSGARAYERLVLSITLARRHGARLTGLFAESALLGQSVVGRRDREQVARAAQQARNAFEASARDAGVPSRWWEVELGEYADMVRAAVICCRYVDLAVFGQQGGDAALAPEGLPRHAVMESGSPVLVVPSAGRFADTGGAILVAWTGSREAARAVRDALPLLQGAEQVTILSLQFPSAPVQGGLPTLDLVEHLRAHGVDATYERAILGEVGAADVVLNRASDVGADLIVMGAHVHSGADIFHRRDTTRDILGTMTTPVLLSS